VSEDAATEQDIKRRIGLACGVMQNLNPILKAKERTKDTKKRVYESNLDEDLVEEMNRNVAEACRLAAYDRHDRRKSVMRPYGRGSPSPRH